MHKKGSRYKSGSVTITVDYGYDIHSITFSGRTYRRVCSGKPITVRGQGFHWDGDPDQDYWQFNVNKCGEQDPKALYVYTAGGGEIFIGHLNDGEVSISLKSRRTQQVASKDDTSDALLRRR